MATVLDQPMTLEEAVQQAVEACRSSNIVPSEAVERIDLEDLRPAATRELLRIGLMRKTQKALNGRSGRSGLGRESGNASGSPASSPTHQPGYDHSGDQLTYIALKEVWLETADGRERPLFEFTRDDLEKKESDYTATIIGCKAKRAVMRDALQRLEEADVEKVSDLPTSDLEEINEKAMEAYL